MVDVDGARDEQRAVVRAPEPISEGDISAREIHGARQIVSWVVAPEPRIEMIERNLSNNYGVQIKLDKIDPKKGMQQFKPLYKPAVPVR